jgi:pyrimidine-nucleoside phosphorylase
MLKIGQITDTLDSGRKMLEDSIKNGTALKKMKEMIEAQGGNSKVVDDPSILNISDKKSDFKSSKSGYIHSMNAEKVGIASMKLGAGREKKEDIIDLSVGIRLVKKTGDPVKAGDTLCTLYYQSEKKLNESIEIIKDVYEISDVKPKNVEMIHGVIE